jgi:putative ABC transport system permease protein
MSPLIKRIPRQLHSNLGKYLGLFLLMFVCIALTSGFLLAAHSIITITDSIPATYHLEDGRLTTAFEASKAQLRAAEDAADDVGGVHLYDNYAVTAAFEKASGGDGKARTVRATAHQETFNVAAYAQGRAPQSAGEIALDRVFAKNVGVGIGDKVKLGGRTFTVCGIMTLPDSQALFEDNADFTLNAVTFGAAEVSQSGMRALEDAGNQPAYTYSFLFNDRNLSVADRTDAEKDLVKALEKKGAQVTDLIDASANQGIGYATDDAEGDSAMWGTLLYLIIVIMAFAFVVLTNATIEEESAVIGTLMASGYRKSELLRHYLALPVLVGLVACVLGAVVGVFALEQPMAGMYYNSYSLPPYQTSWDWNILVQTAVVPFAVLVVITFFGVLRKLNHTPLQFLRHEIGRGGTKRGCICPAGSDLQRGFACGCSCAISAATSHCSWASHLPACCCCSAFRFCPR